MGSPVHPDPLYFSLCPILFALKKGDSLKMYIFSSLNAQRGLQISQMHASLLANTLHEEAPNPPVVPFQDPAKMTLEQMAHLWNLFRRRNFIVTFIET